MAILLNLVKKNHIFMLIESFSEHNVDAIITEEIRARSGVISLCLVS